MIQKITNFSVKYPVTVSMIIVATLLLGYISFGQLGIDLFPDLNNPRLFIEVRSGERPPEEMEDKYVDPIESMSIRQNGVVNVLSVSRVGVARIEVEYAWNKNMDEAFLDLSKALASFNQDEELDELNITQYDPNADPIMLVAFQHKENSNLNELRNIAENYIRNELIRLEGIADLAIDGAEEIEVLVETDDYRLKSYDVDLTTLASKIQSYNQNISGGSIVEMGRRYIVRGLSEVEKVYELEDIIVKMGPSSQLAEGERVPVRLKDVASVSFSPKEQQNQATINGENCIGLSVYKEMRYNTVKAVSQLRNALEEMEKSLPGFKFTIVEDQGSFISGAIGEVRDSLIGGIILAVFVLFLFLRRIGPTAIISFAIPISIIATFVLMYFQGLTLNIMTLGGLALGAGMLVDNAIIVLENIFRIHESGGDEKNAAVKGTSQVGGAIVASTLTTIVVFLPIVYLHGASGELFKEQAITVAFSLLCSLFVAILIIPMLYSRLYKKKSPFHGKNRESVQIKGYGRFLEKALNYQTVILIAALLLIFSGWLMLQKTGSEFMPSSDSNEFYVDVRMPEGTSLERTAGAVHSIEEIIHTIAGEKIGLIYAEIGPASGLSSGGTETFDDQNMATIKVKLQDDASGSEQMIQALNAYFNQEFHFQLQVRQEETALQSILGTDEAPLIVELIGEEMDVLEDLSSKVIESLGSLKGTYNISSSVEGGAPEVEILIDRYRAGLMGIDVNTLIGRVSEKLQGIHAGQMSVSGEMTDITLKLEDITLRELENMSLEVNNNQVLLKELAELKSGYAPKEILHNNQNRIVRITADLDEKIPLDQMAVKVDAVLSGLDMPPKVSYRISGEEAMRKEALRSLLFALILSLVLVYMVLAALFENFLHPFTILLTVPLAVVGAIAVFFIQGTALNIMALIGIVMLVGIAVNDSIILVDAINQFRKEGLLLKDAVIAAGQRRIRPILMTTLTTILALFPLTFGFGESAALRSPMAWAVIGGLITSTMLTLIVIPSVYMVFGKLEIRLKGGKK